MDLLGRCAPEAEAIKAGRSDSLRARAILRSLVSLEDLEGALGLRFILPVRKMEQVREWHDSTHTRTRLTALFHDYPGKPVPERYSQSGFK